jgi:glycosyltransferase involved in cell wall biosynthesis
MVHGEPSVVFKKYLKSNFIKKAICQKSFEKVHTFQILMNSFESSLRKIVNPKNVVRIANPVKQYKPSEIIDLSAEKKKIIYVARIEKSIKQPHLLVEAFAKIAKDFPDWKVEIWGLAKYEDYNREINEFIEKHNMTGQVYLAGYANDIEALYRTADIHAFPSRSEGFSLAIADAMAIGLPHIAFDYAVSVNEIVINNHNGFLVKNVDEFAEKLKVLMTDKNLRIEFGKNASEDMREYAPVV